MSDEKKPDSGRIRTPMSPAVWADETPEPEPAPEPEPIPEPPGAPAGAKKTTKKAS